MEETVLREQLRTVDESLLFLLLIVLSVLLSYWGVRIQREGLCRTLQGDAEGSRVVEIYTECLAEGIVNIVNIFQPEVICIGGGPSAQGETLMAPVRYILNREDYARNNLHRTRLVRAALGNDAGLIGAALLPLFR